MFVTPGEYPMVQGMNLIDLITASGGLIDASYTLASELTRVSVSEKSMLLSGISK